LDSKSGEEILGIFRDLVSGGATIVMVTHNPRIAEQARRVIQLVDGHIVSDSASPLLQPVGLSPSTASGP
jgi:macrolide transport system ATP-binding/permease protein